jgi:carbamoylphosphate synthase large subunit
VLQVNIPRETYHSIPEEIYRKACVTTIEEAVASCQVVGYPAMIKASWGGGGKGIRKVGLFGLIQLYHNCMKNIRSQIIHGKCPLSIQILYKMKLYIFFGKYC